MKNVINSKCDCGGNVVLTWDARAAKCKCGIEHVYKPNTGKPTSRKWRNKATAK